MSTHSPNVFSTSPPPDLLTLFHGAQLKYKDVMDTLEFQKKDVAKAAGMSLNSIRYDAKMPIELKQRFREWATLLNLVASHFDGDRQRTILWFTIPNPLLGNVTPRDMIRLGRSEKLLKFVINAIAENAE